MKILNVKFAEPARVKRDGGLAGYLDVKDVRGTVTCDSVGVHIQHQGEAVSYHVPWANVIEYQTEEPSSESKRRAIPSKNVFGAGNGEPK